MMFESGKKISSMDRVKKEKHKETQRGGDQLCRDVSILSSSPDSRLESRIVREREKLLLVQKGGSSKRG